MPASRTGPTEATGPSELDVLIATLTARDRLSEEETTLLTEAGWRLRDFAAGAEIIADRSRPHESCVLVDGLAARAM
ncbi:MAG TPA: hypothetical protein VFJ18_12735, partial [Pararhizobium sp.]|nr:hypothetical protein [Pararhizobium sp.]